MKSNQSLATQIPVLFLLVFSACAPLASENSNSNKNSQCELSKIQGQYIVQWNDGRHTLEHVKNMHAWKNEFESQIKQIESNYRVKSDRNLGPVNRAEISTVENSATVKAIRGNLGIERAWAKGHYGQNVIVAVIDSGINLGLDQIKDRIYTNTFDNNRNGEDDDHNGFIDDSHGWNFSLQSPDIVDEVGHGTAVASIISGNFKKNEAPGLAPQAIILPVDFMAGAEGNEFDAAAAIEYAISMRAKIINNSWTTTCSNFLKEKFNSYREVDVIFVNAAGNISQDVESTSTLPAALDLPNFINVGSMDETGRVSSFSGWGKTVHLWTIGERIPILTSKPDQPQLGSGTSLSAAIVSGAIAVYWSAHPLESAKNIREQFLKSARWDGAHYVLTLPTDI